MVTASYKIMIESCDKNNNKIIINVKYIAKIIIINYNNIIKVKYKK